MPEEPDWYEEVVVEENYDGWRLDRYLTEKIKRASRSQVRNIIRSSVSIEPPRKLKPGLIVRTGDLVRVARTEHADPDTPDLDDVRIIARGERWIALDKPPGMLVHRTAHEATRTVLRFLKDRFDERVEPVHRLDRDTSGVLLCGVGVDAIRAFRQTFESGEVDKRYRAVVHDPVGHWSVGATDRIEIPLGPDSASRLRIRMGRGDLPCATIVRCVARDDARALLDIRIERGRQHQIRVHLLLRGTPIVGDKLYQAGDEFFMRWSDDPGHPDLVAQLPSRWHALHSMRLQIELDGETICAESAPKRVDALIQI